MPSSGLGCVSVSQPGTRVPHDDGGGHDVASWVKRYRYGYIKLVVLIVLLHSSSLIIVGSGSTSKRFGSKTHQFV